MRAVIYSRISEADGDAMGVGRQVDLCKAEIERRGWELVGVYEDNDISAVGKTRPEYDMLLRDLPSGAFDVVVATEQSRISRDEDGTWVNFRDAYLAAGLSIVDFGGNLIDVASPMGKALSSVSNTMATLERDTLIKRVQAKHQELADRGFWSGGNRPFGYRPVKVTVDGYTGTSLVVDPAEAALIREAVETIKTTGNLMKLARDWNARGIPSIAAELPRMTKKGKPRKASGLWSPTSLRRMLTNPILIGLRTHNGDTVPALWEPILTVAESEAIGKILSASTRRSVLKATKVDFDLRGVLICGNCGRKLEPEYRNGGQPWYGCHSGQHRGCGKVFVSKGNVEAVVLGRLLRLVDDPRIRSIIQASAGAEADEAQRLMIENADDEKMLAEWADMLSKRETDRATYVRQ